LTESIKYGILINIKEEIRRKIQGGLGGAGRSMEIRGSCGEDGRFREFADIK